MAGFLQAALTDRVPGAIADVRQLQTNPVPYPIEIRIRGQAAVLDLKIVRWDGPREGGALEPRRESVAVPPEASSSESTPA